MTGYYNQPAETAAAFTADGFMRTGDIAVMQEDGYSRIVDRKKDMILVSGFNVFPNELENVISLCPGVIECAAIGVPDEKQGEAIKVFVVRKDPSLTEETRDALLQRPADRLQAAEAHRVSGSPAEDQRREDPAARSCVRARRLERRQPACRRSFRFSSAGGCRPTTSSSSAAKRRRWSTPAMPPIPGRRWRWSKPRSGDRPLDLAAEHASAQRSLRRQRGAAAALSRWCVRSSRRAKQPLVQSWDEDALSFRATGQQCPRFRFDGLLEPGQDVALGDSAWQVHAAPGHDPHSIILFEPRLAHLDLCRCALGKRLRHRVSGVGGRAVLR